MSCDGWVRDPDKPLTIDVTCYVCSRPVDLIRPMRGHENCVKANVKDGGLPIQIEVLDENYLE